MGECVEKKLNSIFIKRTGIDFKKRKEMQEEKFFGAKINLPPRELILILYDIEENFNVHIKDELFILGKFDSYINVKYCLLLSLDEMSHSIYDK